MNKNDLIYLAGHKGMVGSAVYRLLQKQGFKNILISTRKEVNLTNQSQVFEFIKKNKPKWVIICAAKVGGILANNNYPTEFIYENMMINNNLIYSSFENGVKNLLFLGSSCIYPKDPVLPITEEQLLSGPLEKTNEAYAIAKISGLKLCEFINCQYKLNYFSLMPCNLYGPNDNYHPTESHVMASLIRKFHEAKANREPEVTIWGSGKPMREFLYVDDLARAIIHCCNLSNKNTILNVGSGEEIKIIDLAKLIKKIIGYNGIIKLDNSKPDGVYRKLIDSSKINKLGWKNETSLERGIPLSIKHWLNL